MKLQSPFWPLASWEQTMSFKGLCTRGFSRLGIIVTIWGPTASNTGQDRLSLSSHSQAGGEHTQASCTFRFCSSRGPNGAHPHWVNRQFLEKHLNLISKETSYVQKSLKTESTERLRGDRNPSPSGFISYTS